MKHVVRGTVLSAGIVLGLALLAPASADPQVSSQDEAKLTEEEQRIFAMQQENNPWYDPTYSGGPGGSGSGNGGSSGGGIGGGSNGGGGAVVPEPGTIALLGLGLSALRVARRRQRAAKQQG